MLYMWNLKPSLYAPMHAVFEHRTSDAYNFDESSWSATSLLRNGKHLEAEPVHTWDEPVSDGANAEEAIVRADYLALDQATPPSATLHGERELARTPGKGQATEAEHHAGTLTRVKFRQALLDVDDPEAFWEGVVGGQVAAVQEQQPLSGTQIFQLFEEAVRDVELSETWLVGYLLGLSDALLRYRKLYPSTYTTQLKPLK